MKCKQDFSSVLVILVWGGDLFLTDAVTSFFFSLFFYDPALFSFCHHWYLTLIHIWTFDCDKVLTGDQLPLFQSHVTEQDPPLTPSEFF